MRTFDKEESARINAQPWQVALLKLNPSYVSWGPGEDYMSAPPADGEDRNGHGWNKSQRFASWQDFGPWGLDELNELVNFHFEVSRDSTQCDTCGGDGYHPHAHWISESFYAHSSPFIHPTASMVDARKAMERFSGPISEPLGRGVYPPNDLIALYGDAFVACCNRIIANGGMWNHDITEDEAAALVNGGRGRIDGLTTADDFNRANRPGARGMGHDGINRWILIEARLKRLGIPKSCPTCDGHGYTYTAPDAHVTLVLWFIHPRKGASRGVEVRIAESDVTDSREYLRNAAKRNAARFAKACRTLRA